MTRAGIVVGEAGCQSEATLPVPWWSFTKTVLATASLVLVGQGRLDLDEPIEGKPYSLRHLLQHTSGLPDYGGLRDYHAAVAAGEGPWPIADLLRRVRSDELLFAPGSAFAYSNIGYLFVRQLIERAIGMKLGAALRTLVFDPLGVDGVFVASSPDELEGTVWGNETRYHPGWVYHGLAVGTAHAAAELLNGLLQGAMLPAHLRTQMMEGASVGGPAPGRPAVAPCYGLGLMIDSRGPIGRVVGHTGQGPGSTGAVYSFLDVAPCRTLAAFVGRDDGDAPGVLETYVQDLVSGLES